MKIDDQTDKSNFTNDHQQDGNVTSHGCAPASPQHSSSELSTVTENDLAIKQEKMGSPEYFPQIDESFWSEEFSVDNANVQSEIHDGLATNDMQFQFPLSPAAASDEDVNAYISNFDDGMDFWYDLFIRAGELPDLPELLS